MNSKWHKGSKIYQQLSLDETCNSSVLPIRQYTVCKAEFIDSDSLSANTSPLISSSIRGKHNINLLRFYELIESVCPRHLEHYNMPSKQILNGIA